MTCTLAEASGCSYEDGGANDGERGEYVDPELSMEASDTNALQGNAESDEIEGDEGGKDVDPSACHEWDRSLLNREHAESRPR